MRLHAPSRPRGFAIIIVLIVIVVLGLLAGAFAVAMKVEVRLAGNANNDAELDWLGRSGVEMARYVLGQSMNQPYTSLNQLWAGGPGSASESNSVLMAISLKNNQLGDGRFSVHIEDLERRVNINSLMPDPRAAQDPRSGLVMSRALSVIGADTADAQTISDSVFDWIDGDEFPRLSGTESDYYSGLTPPRVAKNGPIDDLAEMLQIRGVTPELYWGPSAAHHRFEMEDPGSGGQPAGLLPVYPVGLVDLFCALSNGRLNVNTASRYTLQLIPGVDENVADNIIRARAGPDGVDGTEDDTPFTSPGALNPASVPGFIPEVVAQSGIQLGVLSSTFEVFVDARLGQSQRTYTAIVRRNSPTDVQILQFGWK